MNQYVRSFVRGWLILLVGLVVGAAGGYGLSRLMTPQYTSTTQLFISSTTSDGTVSDAAAASTLSVSRATAYAQFIVGMDFSRRLVQALNLSVDPAQLRSEITATPVADAPIITVTVTDPSPQRAFDVARAVGPQINSMVQTIEQVTPRSPAAVTVSVVSSPQRPASPTSPDVALLVVGGALVGLVLGMIVAVTRDRYDRKIRNDSVASMTAGAPVLGLIPRDRRAALSGVLTGKRARFEEATHVVATNLRLALAESESWPILVTGPSSGQGATTTAIGVAHALSQSGRRVLLVDANLRRPAVARLLHLADDKGLVQVLAGELSLEEAAQSADTQLTVLAAGRGSINPAQLLAGPAMAKLLTEAAARYEIVILDAPPMLDVADAANLSTIARAAVLVVRWQEARVEQVARCRAVFDRARCPVLGVVVTRVPRGRGPYGAIPEAQAVASVEL